MIRRTRVTTCKPQYCEDDDESLLDDTAEDEFEDEDEWKPQEKKTKVSKNISASRQKTRAPKTEKAKVQRKTAVRRKKAEKGEETSVTQALEHEPVEPLKNVKEERLSFALPNVEHNEQEKFSDAPVKEEMSSPAQKISTPRKKRVTSKVQAKHEQKSAVGFSTEEPTCSSLSSAAKKEEQEEDFNFDEAPLKKMKTSKCPEGKPVKFCKSRDKDTDLKMNWDLIQVLSEKTAVDPWVCENLVTLFNDDNTIPFIVRYRKELINYMDADAVRDVQMHLEELRTIAKKVHTVIQTLKKEGVLTADLQNSLLNCRTPDELDHVYAPYKKGSKLTKARRARELGLEPAALALLENPQDLNLHSYIKPDTPGCAALAEVEAGVQQILADIIAKDKDTIHYIKGLCEMNYLTIHSVLSKTALKEQKDENTTKQRDLDKFQLYSDFKASIKTVQHHQILAINRGENLKILTVKVNIPDRVKNEFCRWCVNVRWRPKGYAREELFKILKDAVEDSYKRLIYPLLCRTYRSNLTSSAEKESIAMFVRNLRQLLLTSPVRGRCIMGVDPGYKHGCKLAIISPTSQILHTDVVYLHKHGKDREAEKIRHLLKLHSCYTVVIGNGSACRETEAFFAELIANQYFRPLDVVYCITNEAGASIYSVSPEATKEMPDLDPNLRSAVSIARRVQDPLAELVKIDPKHIGIGTYQHDVSQALLKAALASVVEECVSFVGVDINICSETLMRHIAGLNAGRAKNIIEWREKNGPFINREQLKKVKGVGPTSFQQCAGFIRINPENLRNTCSGSQPYGEATSTEESTSKASSKKSKAATSSSAPKFNPLDQTCIHPESYDTTVRFLLQIGGKLEDIGKPEMKLKVDCAIQQQGLEQFAQVLNTPTPTLQIIIDGLTQPQGFDIRQDFEKPAFKRGIVSMDDLTVGAVLTGRVENTALFGAFVDIGVGTSGLIHKKYITEAKLPQDKRRRSLALGPGERVEVRVLNVDPGRGRIGLDLLRVLK
ncbi:S1 RNA-binding domain-containing protein 1 [Polypterus senegalus]